MHIHGDSGKEWLPRLDNEITTLHPFCGECGLVKNVTSDRARKTGYYANVLQEIKKCMERRKFGRLTEAQMRLILKELQRMDDFEDTYSMRYSIQESIFVNSVRKYTNFSRSFVESFL